MGRFFLKSGIGSVLQVAHSHITLGGEEEEEGENLLRCFVTHKALIMVVPFRGEDGR